MFESTSDVSQVSAAEIVARDAKHYQVRGGQEICIAQVEVVGDALRDRYDELLEALRQARENKGLHLYALMVTDVLSKSSSLLVAGDTLGAAPGVRHRRPRRRARTARRDEPQEAGRRRGCWPPC